MFKYAKLYWTVTFTLDISFSQQSLLDPCLLGQWPLHMYNAKENGAKAVCCYLLKED